MIITIDGPAGSGKSTAARSLARHLGCIHINQGAMFRSVAYRLFLQRLAVDDELGVVGAAQAIAFTFPTRFLGDRGCGVLVNGEDLTDKLFTDEVGKAASQIAVVSELRALLLEVQRKAINTTTAVIEGRDAGSIGFPQADYKFYIDASSGVRAKRRQQDLLALTGAAPAIEEIEQLIIDRDQRDSQRKINPLVKPDGAISIDTSNLKPEQVLDQILTHLTF